MDDFEVELKNGFLDEAQQGVADVEQCFLALETNPSDAENLNKIFRLAHNLKGSSKAVGFDDLGSLTHEFETFILKVKNGEMIATSKVVNLFLRVNDFILTMIEGLRGNFDAKFDVQTLIEELKTFSEDASSADETVVSDETGSSESPVADQATEDQATEDNALPALFNDEILESLSSVQTEPAIDLNVMAQEMMNQAAAVPVPTVNAKPIDKKAASEPAAKAKAPQSADETLRVSLAKVENLINYVGELVILQSVMREQVSAASSPLQKKTMQQMEKVSKEIQDLAMGLRMVPIKPTFLKMQRIVRDTALSLQKDVVINLVGEETELDKTVLEKLTDPLVHLIRNSVDHGIEKSDARLTAGKASQGTVTLSAFHHSGKLVIEVKDDGGGLNAEKLRAKAIEKGILKADVQLSEKEAFNLIFAPGFSTKELVTDVSGRGVGMDVVKTNIQDLGGEVQIESAIGVGSTFRVILPLTLAIIESMIVVSSNHRFVIPMNHVFENLQPNEKSIHHDVSMGDVLLLRDENLPLVRLGDYFGLKSDKRPQEMIAMVVRNSHTPFAILVDDILGQFQVVVKQLGVEAQGMKGVSGVTILGDGKPALIIEPGELIKRKRTNGYAPTESRKTA